MQRGTNLNQFLATFETELNNSISAVIGPLVTKARVASEGMLQEIEERRLRGESELEQKKVAFQAELESMQNIIPSVNDRVILNVGGCPFEISLSTLRSKPGSMLSVLFSGRYFIEKTEDGRVFLDRDGTLFG